MNKRPVFLRLFFAIIVLAVFTISMYPLQQRDFYATLRSLLEQKNDPKIEQLIALSQQKQAKDKNLFASTAIEQSAQELGMDLRDHLKIRKGISDNRDAISLVRKNASSSIRLGLDLNGGVEFTLKLVPDKKGEFKAGEKTPEADKARNREIAIEILRNRLESQNIYESEIAPTGSDYISLKAPIVAKDEKLKLLELIKMSARLQFRLVNPQNDQLVSQYEADPNGFIPPLGYERMEVTDIGREKKPVKHIYFVQIKPEMDGKNITEAFQSQDEFGQRRIILNFNHVGAERFADVTRANVGRQLAIVLDDKLYCAPVIRTVIDGGRAEISGSFSREEAENIANALVSGSLPVKIEVAAVFDTDPTLGKENVSRGIYSGIFSVLLVMAFMVFYYRLAGWVANLALCMNVVLLLGAMAAFECTLTLPGIAGIILTIGMAVDANVLINERIREELADGKTLYNALALGYDRAFAVILDSNLTTLFSALVLMWFGSGPVKGFAVVLTIGIITSMYTALYVSRLTFDLIERFGGLRKIHMMHFFPHSKFDFMGISKYVIIASIAVILGSLVLMGIRGKDSFGVDFTGGSEITINYTNRIAPEALIKTLAAAGFKNANISYKTDIQAEANSKKLVLLIREKDMPTLESKDASPKDEIQALLQKQYPNAKFAGATETSIGGLIGWEFTKSALWSILLSTIAIMIYVAIRFEFTFAAASVIALIHDVIGTLGVYLLIGSIFGGHEITLQVIAGILTIMGYSMNDTVVVFDRIRENNHLLQNTSFKDLINQSINVTLSRTVLTSFCTQIVVVVMLFMGGTAIYDFVLIMFIGICFGTYSSIFVASPIVWIWHHKIGGGRITKAIKDNGPAAPAVKA